MLLGLWAHLPAVSCPMAVDDFAHQAMLDQRWPVARSPLNLYDFASGNPTENHTLVSAGVLPWWSHSELKFRFFRPLSSLLRALDHKLFGSHPLGPHVHSLLWWLACCASAAMLFRKTLKDPIAPLALALFAADASHTMPLGWLANRSFLVATTFALLALERFASYCADGSRRDAFASVALFVLAWLSGEYALCTLAYAGALWLLRPRPTTEDRRRRGREALVVLIPLVIWLLVYTLGRYGTQHSDAYLDPFRRPRAFAIEAPTRWSAHLGELVFGVPADGSTPWGWSQAKIHGLGIACFAAISLALYTLRPIPPSVRWFALGAVLAMVPALPSFGASRLQLSAQIGTAAVLATLMTRTLQKLADKHQRATLAPWSTLLPSLGLAAIHLVITPRTARITAQGMCNSYIKANAIERAPIMDTHGIERAHVILVHAFDGQSLLYPPLVWHEAGIAAPRSWLGLTVTPGLYRLRRTTEQTLVLEAFIGPWLVAQPEAMFRDASSRLRQGDRITLAHVTITVEALQPNAPRAVSYRFSEPLTTQNTRLLLLTGGALRQVPLPPVGGALVIPTPRLE